MFRRQVELQWVVGEESWPADVVWQTQTQFASPSNTTSAEHTLLLRISRGLILLVIVIVAAAGASHTFYYQRYLELKAEIQYSVQLEDQAIRTDDRELYSSLVGNWSTLLETTSWLDPWRIRGSSHRQRVVLTLVNIQQFDEFVVATVRIKPPESHWVPVPYRETRFYRQQKDQWLRITAPPDFWGERFERETEYLRFEYYATDAQAVQQSTERIDEIYLTTFDVLGIQPPEMGYKLTFTVEPRVTTSLSSHGSRLALISPSMYRIPEGVIPANRIEEMVAGHLVNRALSQVMSVTELFHVAGWYNVIMGVRSWMLTELLDRPPYWHETSMRQLHQIRETIPTLQLADLTERGQIHPDLRAVRQTAAETVVAYALERYGQDRLLPLIQGFVTYDSWEELTPAIFGITVEEFTKGWNDYLAEQTLTQ